MLFFQLIFKIDPLIGCGDILTISLTVWWVSWHLSRLSCWRCLVLFLSCLSCLVREALIVTFCFLCSRSAEERECEVGLFLEKLCGYSDEQPAFINGRLTTGLHFVSRKPSTESRDFYRGSSNAPLRNTKTTLQDRPKTK